MAQPLAARNGRALAQCQRLSRAPSVTRTQHPGPVLTEKTGDWSNDDHLSQMAAVAAKPPSDCGEILIRLRYGIKADVTAGH